MKSEPTWYANIWIAGNHDRAVDCCRAFCLETPLCVTITPTTFAYVGGVETGVCVRLIQYPRFPEDIESLTNKAKELAEYLRQWLCQHSYSIEYPDTTEWVSSRPDAALDKQKQ